MNWLLDLGKLADLSMAWAMTDRLGMQSFRHAGHTLQCCCQLTPQR